MADEKKKLEPPQWLGKPIVDPEHVTDLETRAAINEFHSKMPRGQAEATAHDDYVKEQRERAAAHHLEGMKAAMATANHDDARKHWALYDLHLKALGKESVGSVPPEIEKRMNEDGRKPLYKFKAHKGDLYALHQPDQGVPEPMAKGEEDSAKEQLFKDAMAKAEPQPVFCRSCGAPADNWRRAGGDAADQRLFCAVHAEEFDLQKSENKQCQWKLGERRCKRLVLDQYCHHHVGHWANKITQKESKIEKGAMPAASPTTPPPAPTGPAVHGTVGGFLTGLKALPKDHPSRGKFITTHMNHGPFLSALQAHPQGAQIHQMLTTHLNSAANAGFKPGAAVATAKSEHRDTGGQYTYSHLEHICTCGHKLGHHTAGAGKGAGECIHHETGPRGADPCPCEKFKKARVKTPKPEVAKAEESITERFHTLFKAAKLVLTLKKGNLLQFPGNSAPAVDQGQDASVSKIPVRQPPKKAPARVASAAAAKDPGDYNHLIPAEHVNKLQLRVVDQDKGHTAQLLNHKGQVLGSVHGTPTGRSLSKPGGFSEPEIHMQDMMPEPHRHMVPWMQMAIHQHLGSKD